MARTSRRLCRVFGSGEMLSLAITAEEAEILAISAIAGQRSIEMFDGFCSLTNQYLLEGNCRRMWVGRMDGNVIGARAPTIRFLSTYGALPNEFIIILTQLESLCRHIMGVISGALNRGRIIRLFAGWTRFVHFYAVFKKQLVTSYPVWLWVGKFCLNVHVQFGDSTSNRLENDHLPTYG